MSHSINFNSNDLSSSNLKVIHVDLDKISRDVKTAQVINKAYPFRPVRLPRYIELDCVVTGSSQNDLRDNLDAIKLALSTTEVKALKIDGLSGRYFNAVLSEFEGAYKSPTVFQGTIGFLCPDPSAYDNSETSSDFNIDSDPDSVEEAVGGTAYVAPVYTLTAGENLSDITLKVKNETTGEELQWEGSLDNTKELEIDVSTWIVKKDGTADMSAVSGQFPFLVPNETNVITVTNFSNTGTLNITYRKRYL